MQTTKISLQHCNICPRRCGADRASAKGYCGGGALPRLARAALHHWEEPCISGQNGSGTVFFSGCPLQCCFCQNYRISAQNFGVEVSAQRLSNIYLELQEQGAHNINLVNPTHCLPFVLESLELVKGRLHIPVVYNSGGYELPESLALLQGIVDIYLPDLKCMDPKIGRRYMNAPDYFEVASRAVLAMYDQVGPCVFDENGLLKRGLVLRHLVLPGCRADSMALLEWVHSHLPADKILLSVMSQYTPAYRSAEFSNLGRRLSTFEYRQVVQKMDELGFENGYLQERSSAKEEYTPPFDLRGVLKKATEGRGYIKT